MLSALMQSIITLMEVIAAGVAAMALIALAVLVWIILESIRRRD